MKEKLNIIKVGGKIVENPAALSRLISQFAQLPGLKMLVHGGGRTATDIAAQMGVETKMVEGRRVTDMEMLRVVTMVYGGLVNKNVVAQLNAAGLCALGLTGADMDVIRSHRRAVTTVDYGFVGDVDRVDGQRLAQLLERSRARHGTADARRQRPDAQHECRHHRRRNGKSPRALFRRDADLLL